MPKTIKELAEAVTKNPKSTSEQILKIKKLAESEGKAVVFIKEEDKPEDMDPKEATSAAVMAACHAHIARGIEGQSESKDVAATIEKLLDFHNDATEEKKKDESKQKPTIDPLVILEDCRKQNINPSGAELKALCLMESVDRVAWITDQRKKVEPEKPIGGSRGRAPVRESKAADVKDVKSFMEAITA